MAYMTAEQLRERVPALKDQTIQDEWLEDLVEEFEEIAEGYLGVAYEPREVTESHDVRGVSLLLLDHPQVTAVESVEVDGTAVTAFTFTDGWSISFDARQTGLVEVTYTHGYPAPTKPILRACREYVRACALADRSRTPRDAYASDTEGVTYRLSTPDWANNRPTGYMEVDRILNSVGRYRTPGVA